MGDIVEDFKKEFYGDFRYEGTPRGVMAWLPGAVKKREIQAQIDALGKMISRVKAGMGTAITWGCLQDEIDRLKAELKE